MPVHAVLRDECDEADDLAECIRGLPEREFRIAIAMVKVLSRLAAGHPSGEAMAEGRSTDRRATKPPPGFVVVRESEIDPEYGRADRWMYRTLTAWVKDHSAMAVGLGDRGAMSGLSVRVLLRAVPGAYAPAGTPPQR